MRTQFTERVRFNQLKEGDLFTFRKNGILTGNPNDELLRYDNCWVDSFGRKVKVNALCYGGAWFKINNTRCWVWRVPNKEEQKNEKKLKPIECKLTVMTYTEGWKDVYEFERVAISVRKDEKDILESIKHNDDNKTVVMYKEQYEAIFEPLFAEIRALNQKIRELNNK